MCCSWRVRCGWRVRCSWDEVDAAASAWSAPTDAAYGQPRATARTVHGDGLRTVLRAGRDESTWRRPTTTDRLIAVDQSDRQPGQPRWLTNPTHQPTCRAARVRATASSASTTTPRSSANEQRAAAGCGRTSSARAGRSCSLSSVVSRRRSRLRTTAPPTCFEMENPTSGVVVQSPTTTVSGPRRTRIPLAASRRKVRRPRSGRVADLMM